MCEINSYWWKPCSPQCLLFVCRNELPTELRLKLSKIMTSNRNNLLKGAKTVVVLGVFINSKPFNLISCQCDIIVAFSFILVTSFRSFVLQLKVL